MCTKGPSMVQRFASNTLGYTLRTVSVGRYGYAILFLSHFSLLTGPIDPLPRGCSVETLETSKHYPPPWNYFRPSPAYLRMDARRGSHGIRQQPPRHRSTRSCRCSSCCVWSCTHFHRQLSDVAHGLCFLHSRNVVHGDLKGVRNFFHPDFTTRLTRIQSNILVDALGRARITDFGLAAVTQNLDSIRIVSNDKDQIAQWTAPEILGEEGTYGKEADIFSFGMVMIEVR